MEDFMITSDGNISIRHATVDDAKLLHGWWTNEDIMGYAGFPGGWKISEDEIVSMLSKETDNTTGRFIIEIDNTPCGEMIYTNKENNIIELGAKMCNLAMNEKGYGAKALKLFMKHLLETIK
jgi:RimJ/RimL family protein N-acetyltransferase